jgi:uncharacterized membrane protein
MANVFELILITFIPALELRASIPFGIFATELHWLNVFFVCVISNIILGIIVFYLIDWIIRIVTKIKVVGNIWDKYVQRTQRRIQRGVEKYGEWAVTIFIGIPLPGSGVYTGALASNIIGLKFKKFLLADIMGVIIAGIVVTLICLTGSGLSSIFIKTL